MSDATLVNALHPSVVDRLDPQFAEIFTKYQGTTCATSILKKPGEYTLTPYSTKAPSASGNI